MSVLECGCGRGAIARGVNKVLTCDYCGSKWIDDTAAEALDERVEVEHVIEDEQPWTIRKGAVISEPGAAIEVTILELSDRAKEACTVRRKK